MPIELKIPSVGESISEVEIGEWRKAEGDDVKKDETVVVLESEKATVELPAPADGTLGSIRKRKGETATVGEVIGYLEEPGKAVSKPASAKSEAKKEGVTADNPPRVMPAAQRALAEHGLSTTEVKATGPGGRVLKEDVMRQVEAKAKGQTLTPALSRPTGEGESKSAATLGGSPLTQGGQMVPPLPFGKGEGSSRVIPSTESRSRQDEVVPMSRLRRTLAERLVAAQHNTASLTTFNEIDMSSVMSLRKEYGEAFQQKHGLKLGFMSFFVKASIDALKLVPQVNAEIRGTDIVYKNYYDIGVAVGRGKGLVVPVLRNTERMSFAEIELAIADFAKRAKESALKIEELQGGTFTISNGGVYGSMLSTPIINPPQSGILGLHAIQERPVAREGQVVIRPMMYVALTYDHRVVDGREAVTFLKRVKEVIEAPARMLMEI